MEGIVFDEQRWPLVTITFNTEVSDDEYTMYLSRYTRLLERARRRGEKVVCIMDASSSPHTPKHQQKLQSDWLKRSSDLIRAASAGAAFVITSALQRFILSGIFLLAPVATVYKVFPTLDQAVEWSEGRLREHAKTTSK